MHEVRILVGVQPRELATYVIVVPRGAGDLQKVLFIPIKSTPTLVDEKYQK